MASTKGCWTCKDRRVSCDRTIPFCSKCTKSKRACGGYGIRLSWPQQHDQKRAVVQPTISRMKQMLDRQFYDQWINVSLTDVRLHFLTLGANGGAEGGHVDRAQLVLPNISHPTNLMPSAIASDDMELLRYFEDVIADILPMLGSDRKRICRLLMQMALSDRSQSSKAVLLSLLALVSHYRGDDPTYASRTKHDAIEALIATSKPDIDVLTAIEHIAAGVLLCMVVADNECDWIGHLCGAKKVVYAIQQKDHPPGSDASVILGWLYYFDTFARFSFRHWRTDMIKTTATELAFRAANTGCALQYLIASAAFTSGMSTISHHAHTVLQLLAEVFATRLYSYDPEYHSIGYQQSLNELSSRLSDVHVVPQQKEDGFENNYQSLELARIAGLVYLERVSRNFSGASAKLDVWTKQALGILTTVKSSPPPFAIFILGYEANTDDARMVFLDFFTRLERVPHLKTSIEVKGLLQSAWIQKDLEVDGDVEYIHTINLVMSSRNAIPSFM